MNKKVLITIHEAKHLMDVLENDIPTWERSKIDLLLLTLAANPSMAKKGKSPLAENRWEGRTTSPYNQEYYESVYGDGFGY